MTYVRSLLDVTDNLVDGEVVHPPQRARARRRRHLPRRRRRQGHGDVLGHRERDRAPSTASGSTTRSPPAARPATTTRSSASPRAARGSRSSATSASSAWTRPTTSSRAVGIGDMSGDVFGNGMLLSRQDPAARAPTTTGTSSSTRIPDPAASFAERRRLFELPGSSWDDYDREVISEGGGVCPRDAKSIALSPQAREALGIDEERLAPTEVIRAILRAPVDLLWNGGIGTVVKASDESDADAQRPLERRDPRRRARAARAGRGGGRQPRLHAPRAGRVLRRRRARSTPTSSTTRPASTAPTTRST